MLGPQARPSAQWGLNREPFDANCNALTQWATRLKCSNLYYCHELSSGISQWKPTVVCQPQSKFHMATCVYFVSSAFHSIFSVKMRTRFLGFWWWNTKAVFGNFEKGAGNLGKAMLLILTGTLKDHFSIQEENSFLTRCIILPQYLILSHPTILSCFIF